MYEIVEVVTYQLEKVWELFVIVAGKGLGMTKICR